MDIDAQAAICLALGTENSARDVMREQGRCRDEAASPQLPIAVAFCIIQIVSVEECSSWTQNWVQVHCCMCSVVLNATATQYTRSLNGVYRPHWPVQWSRHCSHMCIPVHSPWLPGYVDVAQTVLVIVTMVGLFLDRRRMCIYVCICVRTCVSRSLSSGYTHILLFFST